MFHESLHVVASREHRSPAIPNGQFLSHEPQKSHVVYLDLVSVVIPSEGHDLSVAMVVATEDNSWLL